MKLYLIGHDHKYAAEQMLLTLYPDERPEYPEGKPEEDAAIISVSNGRRMVNVTCRLTRDGRRAVGRATMMRNKLTSELLYDRYVQRMIKTAFYRAAMRLGHERLEWGALTGVRPAKLMAALLDEGIPPEEAAEKFAAEYDVSPQRARLCLDAAAETLAVRKTLETRDICLYIGIPFCPSRCDYCSFVSESVERSFDLIEPFLEALRKEIEAAAEVVREQNLRVISVYIGGGTPTTLTPAQLEELFNGLYDSFDLSALREFTVEAGRPDTITVAKLIVMSANGVTRVSVNPQTMSDCVLEAIGRRHSAQDVKNVMAHIREGGRRPEVNMDLIAGLRGDTLASFKASLREVIELKPENITVHTLSIKRGARLKDENAELPSAEQVGKMLAFADKTLRACGYAPYYLYRQKFMSGGFENVGWTKAGHVNIYNVCMMEELCSVIAMGGGGSTKLIAPADGRNERITEPKFPAEYINRIDEICEAKVKKLRAFYANI